MYQALTAVGQVRLVVTPGAQRLRPFRPPQVEQLHALEDTRAVHDAGCDRPHLARGQRHHCLVDRAVPPAVSSSAMSAWPCPKVPNTHRSASLNRRPTFVAAIARSRPRRHRLIRVLPTTGGSGGNPPPGSRVARSRRGFVRPVSQPPAGAICPRTSGSARARTRRAPRPRRRRPRAGAMTTPTPRHTRSRRRSNRRRSPCIRDRPRQRFLGRPP